MLEVIQKPTEGLAKPVWWSHKRFFEYQKQVEESSTAQQILAFLLVDKRCVGVLIQEQFDSMYIVPSGLGEFGVGSPGPGRTRYTGGIAVVNPGNPIKVRGVQLPPGVSLFHELGHAKQYMENPQWYENMSATALTKSNANMENRLNNEEKYLIEDDNVKRHEGPICEELGFHARPEYD